MNSKKNPLHRQASIDRKSSRLFSVDAIDNMVNRLQKSGNSPTKINQTNESIASISEESDEPANGFKATELKLTINPTFDLNSPRKDLSITKNQLLMIKLQTTNLQLLEVKGMVEELVSKVNSFESTNKEPFQQIDELKQYVDSQEFNQQVAFSINKNIAKWMPEVNRLIQDFTHYQHKTTLEIQELKNRLKKENGDSEEVKQSNEPNPVSNQRIDKGQFTHIQNTLSDFRRRFEQIEVDLLNKVEFPQLQPLAQQMKTFVVKEELYKVIDSLNNYARRSQLDIIKSTVKIIDQKQELYFSKSEITEMIEAINAKILKEAEARPTTPEVQAWIQQLARQLGDNAEETKSMVIKLGKSMSGVKSELKEQELFNKKITTEVDSKLHKSEGKRIWDNFKRYAQYQEYSELYQKVVPAIQGFEVNVLDFTKQQQQHNEIIMRFDEVLAEKQHQTKMWMAEMKEFIENRTVTEDKLQNQMEAFNGSLDQIRMQFEKDKTYYDLQFKRVGEQVQSEINERTIPILKQYFIEEERNEGPNVKVRLEHLAKKVDLIEFQHTLKRMVSKKEAKVVIQNIEMLHNLLIQLSSILVHKLQLNTDEDQVHSVNYYKSKNQQLYNHAKLVDKTISITKFMNIEESGEDSVADDNERSASMLSFKGLAEGKKTISKLIQPSDMFLLNGETPDAEQQNQDSVRTLRLKRVSQHRYQTFDNRSQSIHPGQSPRFFKDRTDSTMQTARALPMDKLSRNQEIKAFDRMNKTQNNFNPNQSPKSKTRIVSITSAWQHQERGKSLASEIGNQRFDDEITQRERQNYLVKSIKDQLSSNMPIHQFNLTGSNLPEIYKQ